MDKEWSTTTLPCQSKRSFFCPGKFIKELKHKRKKNVRNEKMYKNYALKKENKIPIIQVLANNLMKCQPQPPPPVICHAVWHLL